MGDCDDLADIGMAAIAQSSATAATCTALWGAFWADDVKQLVSGLLRLLVAGRNRDDAFPSKAALRLPAHESLLPCRNEVYKSHIMISIRPAWHSVQQFCNSCGNLTWTPVNNRTRSSALEFAFHDTWWTVANKPKTIRKQQAVGSNPTAGSPIPPWLLQPPMICGVPRYVPYADRCPFRPLPRGYADRCLGLKHRQSISFRSLGATMRKAKPTIADERMCWTRREKNTCSHPDPAAPPPTQAGSTVRNELKQARYHVLGALVSAPAARIEQPGANGGVAHIQRISARG